MATSKVRDEFSPKTKTRLAMRAGYRCSIPGCGRPTVGPSDDSPDSVVNVGIAAHIYAASPLGPRYEENMKPDERKDIRNGIWLCAIHGQEVDKDIYRFPPDTLIQYKVAHEKTVQDELHAGNGIFRDTDIFSLGPDITFLGQLSGSSGRQWYIRVSHFIEGTLADVVDFSGHFDTIDVYERYLLSNALGDGRLLTSAPGWEHDGQLIKLTCEVAEKHPRIDAQKLPTTFALNENNDIFIADGDLATVKGLDALPQRLKEALSMLYGESPYYPKAGSRLKEYFDEFENTPWLRKLVKLEVIRLASVPYRDRINHEGRTPLQCVLRVEDVIQLEDRAQDWVLFSFKLAVQGVGKWEGDVPIFIPRGPRPELPHGWGELKRNI